MLEFLKIEELRKVAKHAGIKNVSKYKKQELLDLLTATDTVFISKSRNVAELFNFTPTGLTLVDTVTRGSARKTAEGLVSEGEFSKIIELPYPTSPDRKRTLQDVANTLTEVGEVHVRKDLFDRLLALANITREQVSCVVDGPFYLVKTVAQV